MTKQKNTSKIKNKFINYLVSNGKKNKSEKIILKSIKTLQTLSKKSSLKLTQLALISNTPIFKLNTTINRQTNKKKQNSWVMPIFVFNKFSRVFFAIKFIVKITKKKKHRSIFKELSKEILLTAQNKSNGIQIKKEIQKQALLSSYLFRYYRWH